MNKLDTHEEDILKDYENGELVSDKLVQETKHLFKAAARATSFKDRRVNIRLSSPDLRDIQARALEEGIPYQTLIASILHKYVTGRLLEKPSRLNKKFKPDSQRPVG